MTSKVYFADVHAHSKSTGLLPKLRKLFDASGYEVNKDDIVAVKVHFGEKGNTAFVNPVYVRQIVDKIKEKGGKPFLTDTNTLYNGARANAVDHIETAIQNGFAYAVVNAPIIIADGIHSKNSVEVDIDKKHFQKVKIAKEIENAKKMVVISHFKGHEIAGFGGAIKNLAMGCAPAAGKQQQHSVLGPEILETCVGCKTCIDWCPMGAISVENKKAIIDEKCFGCGECISICPKRAISPQWETDSVEFLERMTEYAYGAVKNKMDNVLYISVLMNITPLCDCLSFSGSYIVPDIGILASTDPVAIDAASLDLVNSQLGNPNSSLKCNHGKGEDKFMGLNSHVDGSIQLKYGQEIGLGSKEYEIVKL